MTNLLYKIHFFETLKHGKCGQQLTINFMQHKNNSKQTFDKNEKLMGY